MKKRIFTMVLAVFISLSLIPVTALAETDMEGNLLPVLEKPVSISPRITDNPDEMLLRFTQPDSVMEIITNKEDNWESPLIELDIKVNDGPWTFDRTPGTFREYGLAEYYDEHYADILGGAWPGISSVNVILQPNFIIHDELNSFDGWLFCDWMGLDSWNLATNTYYFRIRYVYEYGFYDESSDTWGYKEVVSPWSDIGSIGEKASGKLPESLEAPLNLKGELKTYDNGQPYFHFTYTIPESVEEANKLVPVVNYMDWKIGSGNWASDGVDLMFQQGGSVIASSMDLDPIDKGGFGEVNIEKNIYTFRMCFQFTGPDGSVHRSPFSNTVKIGVEAWSKASSWATEELEKADGLGLIPDSLRGEDMTKPITRAEFAAISVKVYESLSNTNAVPIDINPFTDTQDAEVLKAYNVGITDGVGGGKFAPDKILNREQAATMLTRVYKKVSMSGWTLATDGQFSLSYINPAAFSDDSKISSWAKDSVYFMAANGIINGTGNNMFSPRATTPAEEARNYASATREQALLIAVRMVENLK